MIVLDISINELISEENQSELESWLELNAEIPKFLTSDEQN